MPTRVFGHGWLLVGGEKMSKSKATAIAPEVITDTFGSDVLIKYLAAHYKTIAITAENVNASSMYLQLAVSKDGAKLRHRAKGGKASP